MGNGSAALWGWGGWSIPPSMEALETIRAKTICASVSCLRGPGRELVSATSFSTRATGLMGPGITGRAGVELTLCARYLENPPPTGFAIGSRGAE